MFNCYFNCFENFSCLMGECKHTCCAMWNISVDKKSYKKYLKLKGGIKQKILDGIDKNTLLMKIDNHGRCPFLNDKNLCEIIINHGEKYLCSVCSLHPRFKTFFHKTVETGFGVSCEKACDMLVSHKGNLLLCYDKTSSPHYLKKEKTYINFRQDLINIVQNKNLSLKEKIDLLMQKCKVNLYSYPMNKWAELLSSFECLDSNWGEKLQCLTDFQPLKDSEFNNQFENILSYFIFRHSLKILSSIEVYINSAFAIFSFLIVYNIFYKKEEKTEENLKDILRSFSAEIEYSESNQKAISDKIELMISLL